ncbi:MAG: efflux RND transporter permease subunit [Planctomycetes bacterium]|nr:efflux RND transporter permease subunit [Planctomycetota bacterium]
MPETPAEDRREHPGFAALLGRPVTALMAFILIVLLGVVSYLRIPIMLLPKGIAASEMTIMVPCPDSSPTEVLEQVTKPLEDAIRTLPDVTEVNSESEASSARVSVSFAPNTDMDLAYNEIQDRIERTKPSFPEGVSDIRIWRWNSDVEMPIFWLGILYEDTVADPFGVVEEVIQPRFEAVDGVARVQIHGMVEDSVRVFVSPEALRSHGLSLYDVVATLRRDNFTLPAGSIDDGGREFLLRIEAGFHSLDEIRQYPIRENVQVQDVADVRIEKAYRDNVSRVNGYSSLTAVLNKESDENTVAVCQRVMAQIEEMKRDERLAGFQFNVYFNQADVIVSSLGNLKSSMGWGALFSLLILYAFVRRVAMTLMVALAIPVSLLAALVAVYFSGFTFNILSLAGFTLAIGMLVDNSIVVAENVARLRALGWKPFAAAASGAGQVGLAIILSTLTTIIVFTPLVFMAKERNTRILLGELAAPITYSLLASLLTALVFLPIATVQLSRRRTGRAAECAAPSAYSGASRLLSGYRRLLAFTLRHRFGVTVFTLAVIALGAQAWRGLQFSFEEGGHNDRLRIDVKLPRRFTLAEASAVFDQFEEFLLARRKEYQFEDLSVFFDRRRGEAGLWFDDDAPRPDSRQLSWRLREELPKIPGVEYEIGFEAEGAEAGVHVQLYGPDSVELTRIGDELVRELQRLPELSNVRTDVAEGFEELRVGIDRDRAQRFGVSQEILQGLIAWGVGGQRLAGYRGEEREIPLLIEYEEPQVGDLNYLRALDVPVDREGGSVPLAALTHYRFEKSLGSILRKDGITSLGVQADSYDKNSYRIQRKVAAVLEDFPFPEGYGWKDAGRREEFEEGLKEVGMGLFAGICFVFLLMGMLFESAILPLSVLLTIPLAMVGGILALFITRTPLDGMAQLAFILLAGVVVNNGIVLVDRIRQVQNAGMARTEAILTGCAQRVRPVLMTALTTIFGLLPMALPKVFASGTNSGLSYESLAIATLGGLILSTLLTLFVVPLFYSLFDDLGRVFLSPLRPRAARDAAEPPPEVTAA